MRKTSPLAQPRQLHPGRHRPRHAEFVRLMRAAGVLVRDRSNDPGCDGRVRITIGTREQMRRPSWLSMRPSGLNLGAEAR
jgi:hypothetical protein